MNVFVSGASRGIGRSVVEGLARQGHDVAFSYFSGGDAATQLCESVRRAHPDRRCEAWRLDVRDSSQVDDVAERVCDAFNPVGALVANAGTASNGLALHMSDEAWNDALATNLSGAFFLCRAFLPHFVGHRFGRIVLVSSITRNGASGQIAYSTAKAGLVGMGMTIAKEYGARGVTCNVVAPGYIETEMTQAHASERNIQFWQGSCPAGRVGQPHEAASAIAYLCSEEASFVNGATLTVNGGLDWLP